MEAESKIVEELKPESLAEAAAEAGKPVVEHGAHHYDVFYHDPKFWVAVAFAIFVLLAAKYIWPFISKGLDKRSDAIRDQLEQAARLRAEAEELLAQYKAQEQQMLKDAQDILAHATRDAEAIRSKAGEELTQALARRTTQAEEGIARAEAEAVGKLKAQMVDIATAATRSVVTAQLDGKKEDPTVARALSAIEGQMH